RPAAPPSLRTARIITSKPRSCWLRSSSSSGDFTEKPALLTRTSTGSSAVTRRSATRCWSARSERAAASVSTWTPNSARSCAATSARRSASRATSTRAVPRPANALAKAAPIPAVPPVIRALCMAGTIHSRRPAQRGEAPWWEARRASRAQAAAPGGGLPARHPAPPPYPSTEDPMSHSTSPAAQSATGGSTSGGRRILLTGVTGFLGQAVLRSLLETTEDVHVTAVVRPKGSVTGRRRLEQLLRKPVFSSWADLLAAEGTDEAPVDGRARLKEIFDTRVGVLEGDLTDMPEITDPFDTVIHSA